MTCSMLNFNNDHSETLTEKKKARETRAEGNLRCARRQKLSLLYVLCTSIWLTSAEPVYGSSVVRTPSLLLTCCSTVSVGYLLLIVSFRLPPDTAWCECQQPKTTISRCIPPCSPSPDPTSSICKSQVSSSPTITEEATSLLVEKRVYILPVGR